MLGRRVAARRSDLSSPMTCNAPPQQGQIWVWGSMTISSTRQIIRRLRRRSTPWRLTHVRILALRLGLCRGNSRLEILKAKRHLLWRKLFRTLAILTANIFIEDALKPLDLFVTMR